MNQEEQAVAAVLMTYQEALNASSTKAVMPLYTADGVFMPQNSPSSIGTEAIREAYDRVFAAITLQVRFEVAEVKQLSAEWVFARTNSAGTATIHATNGGGSEANQELFLFQKVDGAWKIARYCFSTTHPA